MKKIDPSISVIIPVYNDREGLKDTLEAFKDQSLNQEEYEVIVVDNDSTDDTSEVIKEFSERYKNFRGLVEDRRQSSYAARNTGIKASKGEIICFIDADMWADTDYLEKIKDFFKSNQDIDYIGCNVEIIDKSGTMTSKYDKLNAFPVHRYVSEKDFAPTCCLSLRSTAFVDVGLFNPELVSGGDKLFGRKVKDEGLKMQYVDEIRLYHPARDHWIQIASKYFRIGRGWYQKKDLGEKLEDEDVGIIDVYSSAQEILENLGEYVQNKELGMGETVVFTYLTFMKKFSMFSGYQYQRISHLIE